MQHLSRAQGVFGGGRAPGSWQREMTRQFVQLGLLRWASGWIKTLVSGDPKLHDEPLFGQCLTILVNRLADRSERNAEREIERNGSSVSSRPSRQTPFPQPASFSDYGRHSSQTGDDSASSLLEGVQAVGTVRLPHQANQTQAGGRRSVHHSGPAAFVPEEAPQRRLPFHLEPRVSRNVLQRLVNHPISTDGKERSSYPPQPRRIAPSEPTHGQAQALSRATSSSPSSSPARTAQAHRLADSTEASRNSRRGGVFTPGSTDSPTAISPVVSGDFAGHRAWLHSLTQRVWQGLSQSWLPFDSSTQHAAPDRAALSAAPSLADSWATRLNGQSVPVTLLTRLAYAARVEHRGTDSETRTSVGSLADSSPAQPSLFATRLGEPSQASGAERGEGGPAALPVVHRDRTETLSHEAELPAPAVIPGTTPVLPPLPQSHAESLPTLSLVAALARQEGGVQATTGVGEDLEALATKIKDILDAEARRYGIDV